MTDLPDVDTLAHQQSFVVRKVVRESYDHNVYLVEHEERHRVLKVAVSAEAKPNLRREVGYCEWFNDLAASAPELSFRAATTVAFGDGWCLRELLDAPPLVDPDADTAAYAEAMPRLARVLADFDTLAPTPGSRPPRYRDKNSQPRVDDGQRIDEVARWVDAIRDRDVLSARDAEESVAFVGERMDNVLVGFEMFDVKIEDFLRLSETTLGVYDLEYAHLFGRRYYDVAKFYVTLRCAMGHTRAATVLLSEFAQLQHRSQDEFFPAFVPVVTMKAIGTLHDAAQDASATVNACRDLLQRCRTDDLSALLDDDAPTALRTQG